MYDTSIEYCKKKDFHVVTCWIEQRTTLYSYNKSERISISTKGRNSIITDKPTHIKKFVIFLLSSCLSLLIYTYLRSNKGLKAYVDLIHDSVYHIRHIQVGSTN